MDRPQIVADIGAASDELAKLTTSVDFFRAENNPSNQKIWEITNSLGMVTVKVYTGLETVLTRIVKDIDGPPPDSGSFHKKLLQRAAARIEGRREPIIDEELRALLAHLLGFRHLVLKRYAADIDLTIGLENYDRAKIALPLFEKQVLQFVDAHGAAAPGA